MPASYDIKGIIRHVAEIIIDELKLEDVTADTFSRIWIWLMNWGLTAWIWRRSLWFCRMNTELRSMKTIIPH